MSKSSSSGRYKSGLVSITFRKLSVDDIISLVQKAGQQGIEWGGDVHVPAGNLEQARIVGDKTRQAGLEVACYGSYYRCGPQESGEVGFEKTLQTARELGAPSIRVWAGRKNPQDYDPREAEIVKQDYIRICELAQPHNIQVATEYHGGTLTETPESTRDFFQGISLQNAKSLWQPRLNQSPEHRSNSIDEVLSRLLNVHVFHWGADGPHDKRPLEEGEAEWLAYLQKIASDGQTRWALMEFVRNDSIESYLDDAQTLNRWIITLS